MTPQFFRNLFLGGMLAMTIHTSLHAETVSVRVTDIDTSRPGRVLAMLFVEQGFPKDHSKALFKQSLRADQQEIVFEFTVESDAFAIKILHDENEDGKTSKNWTGIIPSEGLGFSNGAKLTVFGPPNFKKAALRLSEIKNDIVIPVVYP